MTIFIERSAAFRDLVNNFFYNAPPDAPPGDAQHIHAIPQHGTFEIRIDQLRNPIDPFRWNTLRTLIGSRHVVRLLTRQLNERITDVDVYSSGRKLQRICNATLADTSRNPADTGGVTILGQWVLSENQTFTGPVASNQDTFAVYQGVSSLSHELFGHTFLGLISAPNGHDQNIQLSHNVPTPYTQIKYVGSVNDYLEKIVGHMENPTYYVGNDILLNSLRRFKREFASVHSPINIAHISRALKNDWRILNLNYSVMINLQADNAVQARNFQREIVPPAGSPNPSNLGNNLIKTMMIFFNTLAPNKQRDFRLFIHDFNLDPDSRTDPFGARINLLKKQLYLVLHL